MSYAELYFFGYEFDDFEIEIVSIFLLKVQLYPVGYFRGFFAKS